MRSHLESRRESATLPAADLLCNCMNRLLAREIARQAFGKAGLARELTSAQLEKAAGLAKGFVFPVTDTQGWKQAQVMAGGVPLGEIRPETMESRRCPGLYLAGELLNLDGDCGGYNLHWAFATGILAGKP